MSTYSISSPSPLYNGEKERERMSICLTSPPSYTMEDKLQERSFLSPVLALVERWEKEEEDKCISFLFSLNSGAEGRRAKKNVSLTFHRLYNGEESENYLVSPPAFSTAREGERMYPPLHSRMGRGQERTSHLPLSLLPGCRLFVVVVENEVLYVTFQEHLMNFTVQSLSEP